MLSPRTPQAPPAPLSSTESELEVLIRARYPILYVVSWEEERVEEALGRIAQRRRKKLVCWSAVRGLHAPDESVQRSSTVFNAATCDPLQALDEVIRQVEPIVFLFKDLHPLLGEQAVVRKLREVAGYLKSSHKTLVLVSPTMRIPVELEKDVTVLDYALPRLDELGVLLDALLGDLQDQGQVQVAVPPAVREKLLQAARGLTLKEAENAFARTVIQTGRLTEAEVGLILDEKKRAIRKSGILEYYDAQEHLDHVGGLDALKEWVRKRSSAFTEEAKAFGLPPPKGVLLIGVQGCGKSLCARAISQVWQLPLLRLDVGRIFSSFMGASEENARKAIATAESVAPALLWIDEIEKAFAGRGGSDTDGGTSSRVFGTFLTWLQEKQAPVFVIATANQIRDLPPELMRKGRFDEIFFVDIPDATERAEIFAIHLSGRGRDPHAFDLPRLAERAQGFSGSEIEQSVIGALYEAFDRGAALSQADVEHAVAASVPLSHTMREDIDALREWAQGRARDASGRTR